MALTEQPISGGDVYAHLSRNVRILMGHHGYRTQKELAAVSDVEASALNRMLNGDRAWTFPVAAKLARGFGMELWELLLPPEELLRSRWNIVPPGELPSQLDFPFDASRALAAV